MRKIFATVVKEWTLLRRDAGGLLLLFLMPALLIVVMALIQDAPFRDYQEQHFDLLFVDSDSGSLAREIRNGLTQSKSFHIVDSMDGRPLDALQLKALLQQGKYNVGIIVPRGATAEVANAANTIANSITEQLGLGSLPARDPRTNTYIQLYFDPAAKPAFRLSVANALDKFVTYSCSSMLVKRLSKLGKAASDTLQPAKEFKNVFGGIGVKEEMLNGKATRREYINSVQHNVPAWAVFGMFFIVLPIVSNTLKEREEGSTLRLALIPGAHRPVALGRILFYMLVCVGQFVCMCAIGIWVMPVLGLNSLHLGAHPSALVPVVISIAFAATAYGYFVSSVFRTANQAAIFGAISIVLLSAMGGIWVPIELLTSTMQQVARLSPLHWSLEAINTILLRDGDTNSVLLHMAVLTGLGIVLWLFGVWFNKKRPHSF